jgi:hypothetical protein
MPSNLPKLDKVPIVYRSERPQLKQSASDQNNPDLAAIEELLSSGALDSHIESETKSHALIRQTANQLRSRARKDQQGILLSCEGGALDVRVTEGTIDLALLVMSRVLSVLEKHNLNVEASAEGGSVALIQGQRISFGIEEPIRRL